MFKDPLRFALYRPDGSLVWREVEPLSWTDSATTQTLSRQPREQFFGGGMQNGSLSHPGQVVHVARSYDWNEGGYPSSAPFYVSTADCGVFRDTFALGTYDFGDPVATTHEEKRFDAYYFVGGLST